jgi:hypothetical protein
MTLDTIRAIGIMSTIVGVDADATVPERGNG